MIDGMASKPFSAVATAIAATIHSYKESIIAATQKQAMPNFRLNYQVNPVVRQNQPATLFDIEIGR